MKKLWKKDRFKIIFVLKVFIVWRLLLFLLQGLSQLIPLNLGYLGSSPWANFDGVHYLSIAENGYYTYQQAFFPLFPILIKSLSPIFLNNYLLTGFFIVHVCFLLSLYILFKLAEIDFSVKTAKWSIIFLCLFPTSFFFASIYTESLFLLLTLSSFYFVRKYNFFLSSLFSAISSSTRLAGAFLFPSILIEYLANSKKTDKQELLKAALISVAPIMGLTAYMIYLWIIFKDPFFFIHAQPFFGAGRSGGDIVLLPQVVFRYLKIFYTVPMVTHDFLIAALEFIVFFGFLAIIAANLKKIRRSYIMFSILALIIPALSGTLSSTPRYVLTIFPVFLILGNINSNFLRYSILIGFFIILVILTAYFLRGYFIA